MEALNLLITATSLPDLILLDLIMPKMDGFEFLQAYNGLKSSLSSEPKIVILTAVGTDTNMSKLYSLGINDIITKPLTNENLLNVIHKYFEISSDTQ